MAELEQRIARLVGDLHNAVEHKALREATRTLIAPLIERAPVTRALKDAALSSPPKGVLPEEVGFPADEVAEHVAGFVESGSLRVNERGAYELTDTLEPSVREALKHAGEILREAGWPTEQAAQILAVFEGEDKEPDYDDDEADEDK